VRRSTHSLDVVQALTLVSSPLLNERLTNEEKHRRDLSDGEETPNAGLFHEVGGDEGGQVGPTREEEHALDHHAWLLVESEEGCEHEEGVDGGAGNDVGGVSHRD